MRSIPVLLSLLCPVLASAVPLSVSHQGRLADVDGAPLTGEHTLTFSLYASDTDSSALWQESQLLTLNEGYFQATLGAVSSLDSALFDGSVRYLGIAVDGAELPSRLGLLSVPYAITAGSAESVAFSAITGVPDDLSDGDDDALSGLSCADGQVLTWAGADWTCGDGFDLGDLGTLSITNLPVGTGPSEVAAGDHTHSFDAISGTAAITQLPVGTGSGQVAAGDHAHGFEAIVGTAAITQLPVGTSAGQVAAGNHGHAFGEITGSLDAARLTGTLPAGVFPANVALNGSLKLGNNTATCNSAVFGTLRWSGTSLDVCTANGWTKVVNNVADGSSAALASRSCKQLHTDLPALPSGAYWVDTDGSGSNAAFQVYCDMVTDGGGWTLVGLTNGPTELNSVNLNADVTNPGVGNYVKSLRGLTGTDTRLECGATGTGVLGHQFTTGTWDWTGTLLVASQNAPYNENITWRVRVPGYTPPGGESDAAWTNHVGGVHYPNFGYTGFSAIDGRIFRQGVFTCDPQNSVYGTGDVAWASTTGTRFYRYWLR